jgi:hypothetical protein
MHGRVVKLFCSLEERLARFAVAALDRVDALNRELAGIRDLDFGISGDRRLRCGTEHHRERAS